VFQVDQARRIEAAAWVAANTENAVRNASRVRSSRAITDTSVLPVMIAAI